MSDDNKQAELDEAALALARGDILPEPEADPGEADHAEPDAGEPDPAEADAGEADAGEADAGEGEGAKRKDNRIPVSRFNEAVGKERSARKAAEERAAALEAQLAQADTRQAQSQDLQQLEQYIEELEDARLEAEVDGDSDKVKALGREIRVTERQLVTQQAQQAAAAVSAQTLEQRELEATVARLEADVPEFNPESEVYDGELVELVLSKQTSRVRAGLNPARALIMAAEEVKQRFLQRAAAEAPAKGLAQAVAQDRRAAQVKKNLDTATRQPAAMGEAGRNADALGSFGKSIGKMSDKEFEKLSDAELAAARGDLL